MKEKNEMKEMSQDLYRALKTLKHECKSANTCAQCPLSITYENGNVECILKCSRPCNLTIVERYYVGKGVFSA